MKKQLDRLHHVLALYHAHYDVKKENPHTVLRIWQVWHKGDNFNHWVYVLEEVNKPAGDAIPYQVQDPSKDLRFMVQFRLPTPVAENLRRLLGVSLVAMGADADYIEQTFWTRPPGSPVDLVIDIFDELKKYLNIARRKAVAAPDSEDAYLALASAAKKPRPRTKLKACMDSIFEIFKGNKLEDMEATNFDELKNQFSHPLILKSKVIMDIRSYRIAGRWMWAAPKRTPDRALQASYDKKLIAQRSRRPQLQERESVKALREFMSQCNYQTLGEAAVRELPYKRVTVLKAKQALKIKSIKRDKKSVWVWPAEPVKEWLIDMLKYGPVPVAHIFGAAESLGWEPPLIRAAKSEIKGINSSIIDEIHCWYNINAPMAVMKSPQDDGEIPEEFRIKLP